MLESYTQVHSELSSEGVSQRLSSPASCSPDGDEVAAVGKEPPPQYTVMPTSINDVKCAPMSAFLLQDPAPWIALQSMDGSGELAY